MRPVVALRRCGAVALRTALVPSTMRLLDGDGKEEEEDRRLIRSDSYGTVDSSEDFVLYALPLAFFAVTVLLNSLKFLFPNLPLNWFVVFSAIALLGTWNFGRE